MPIQTVAAVPDLFLLPEWGNAYASHDHGEIRRFTLQNEYGRVIYQFVLRPVPNLLKGETYFDTITPFGLNGPVVLESTPETKEKLIASFDEAFQQYCEENRIVSEYIRFCPWLGNVNDFGSLYSIDKRGITMYIDLSVPDFFMKEFSSASRQQVRRALKNGVELEYDETGETLPEFCRLYELMAKRNCIPDHYQFSEAFLRETFRHLKGRQFILTAKKDGIAISAALFVHHGDYLHYHLAANDPAYFCFAGNSLILHEGCRWGVAHGKKELHLGGASTEPLYRFKRGFTKTEPLPILTGKRVRNKAVYTALAVQRLRQKPETDTGYFPLYRG